MYSKGTDFFPKYSKYTIYLTAGHPRSRDNCMPNTAYASKQNNRFPSDILWELIDIPFYIIINKKQNHIDITPKEKQE